MPNTCSAPKCRSDYAGEPTKPVFNMPDRPPEIAFLSREILKIVKELRLSETLP